METALNMPFTREARRDEFGTVYELAARAFIHDSMMNYLGNQKRVGFTRVFQRE